MTTPTPSVDEKGTLIALVWRVNDELHGDAIVLHIEGEAPELEPWIDCGPGGDWSDVYILHEDSPEPPPAGFGLWQMRWPWHRLTAEERADHGDELCCLYEGKPEWTHLSAALPSVGVGEYERGFRDARFRYDPVLQYAEPLPSADCSRSVIRGAFTAGPCIHPPIAAPLPRADAPGTEAVEAAIDGKKMREALAFMREQHNAPCDDPACDSVFCFLLRALLALYRAPVQTTAERGQDKHTFVPAMDGGSASCAECVEAWPCRAWIEQQRVRRDDPALLRQAVVDCLPPEIVKLAEDVYAPTLGGMLMEYVAELEGQLEERRVDSNPLQHPASLPVASGEPIEVLCPDCGKPMAQARKGEAVFLCGNLECVPRKVLGIIDEDVLKRKILADPDVELSNDAMARIESALPVASEPAAEIVALRKDQADWRKGVRLIASYLGYKGSDLSCPDIAMFALEMRARLEALEQSCKLAFEALDVLLAAAVHCGDPDAECPMQDVYKTWHPVQVALAARAALTPPSAPQEGKP